MQAGKHLIFFQMLIQQLTEVPELGTYQQADRIGIRLFSEHLEKNSTVCSVF